MRRLCLTALLAIAVIPSAAQPPQNLRVEIKALEITDEASFDTQGFQLFREGFRCDGSGNVFFLPGLRTLERPPAAIVRASTNGGAAAKSSLSPILRIPAADIRVIKIAADTRGHFYALVETRNPDGARQLIASFDDQGQLKSQVELSLASGCKGGAYAGIQCLASLRGAHPSFCTGPGLGQTTIGGATRPLPTALLGKITFLPDGS